MPPERYGTIEIRLPLPDSRYIDPSAPMAGNGRGERAPVEIVRRGVDAHRKQRNNGVCRSTDRADQTTEETRLVDVGYEVVGLTVTTEGSKAIPALLDLRPLLRSIWIVPNENVLRVRCGPRREELTATPNSHDHGSVQPTGTPRIRDSRW